MQHTVSSKTLIKASITALFVAIIALVLFILPAEYNIDPTGIGKQLGVTKIAQASEQKSVKAPDSLQMGSDEFQTIEVTIPANRGIEYKFEMQQYEKMTYEWMTDGDSLYFDLHGEPVGDTTGYFESYAIANLNEMKGSFTAPFAGSHGWYWKNNSDSPVAIQLLVKGQFKVIGLKK
ncbi:hypothetical protein I6E78_16800 [Pseudoalteromonas sp. NZS127]|uniref:Transmembrane anchor protein n=1 Tax=Pseudoalteromonas neustonica TaxID=1840331 RepID=A0ABY3FEI8_9GAMM|nr:MULTISPECIES: hypothetical protein [Pseudoalteromonas]MBH0073615.1 hypothetical protein [Pseudoalteromonas sp. NZS127]TVU82924.1 hypothetical protein FQP85_12190 [Pseudoalteromonas neustonica]|tara:strand:+ start:8444 stop:8974 length:531 start_codon:yes stop_codon:yes gene_type:complete